MTPSMEIRKKAFVEYLVRQAQWRADKADESPSEEQRNFRSSEDLGVFATYVAELPEDHALLRRVLIARRPFAEAEDVFDTGEHVALAVSTPSTIRALPESPASKTHATGPTPPFFLTQCIMLPIAWMAQRPYAETFLCWSAVRSESKSDRSTATLTPSGPARRSTAMICLMNLVFLGGNQPWNSPCPLSKSLM